MVVVVVVLVPLLLALVATVVEGRAAPAPAPAPAAPAPAPGAACGMMTWLRDPWCACVGCECVSAASSEVSVASVVKMWLHRAAKRLIRLF